MYFHQPKTTQESIFQLDNEDWYVATEAGPEGPLENREEAQRYVELLNAVNAAGWQMVGFTL